ncbi:hypothetical protein V0U79_10795 [Hyphobacterium sp. HN65]|uniref:C-type lysozyme inhibitor domain-containing protein n=1 Tax=Hyphobacterium lacteum TaxID=3116575 RepID=A0ABU7LU46_9PROT|nr:hypothetical protein [Hyphobacterium sp. HN65]MEE2526859.1 hypothetical protein [Hyphobacterium sp. HN65]
MKIGVAIGMISFFILWLAPQADAQTRIACLDNRIMDGHSMAVQWRACDENSHNCLSWQEVNISPGDTAIMTLRHHNYEYLSSVYFEMSIQSGSGHFTRETMAGGRVNADLTTYQEALGYCGGRRWAACGDGTSTLYVTNDEAASTDWSCRRN